MLRTWEHLWARMARGLFASATVIWGSAAAATADVDLPLTRTEAAALSSWGWDVCFDVPRQRVPRALNLRLYLDVSTPLTGFAHGPITYRTPDDTATSSFARYG